MSDGNNTYFQVELASQLLHLQARKIENPQTLSLQDLTEEIVTAFEQTLQVWKTKCLIWRELEITVNEFGARFLCRTLESVNEARLFESISIEVWGEYQELPEDLVLFGSFETNHRLKKLKLTGVNFNMPNIQAMSRTLRFSESLQELSFDRGCCGMLNDEQFCDALASNSSLDCMRLLCDEDTSSIIAALVSHRNLKRLLDVGLTWPSNFDGIPDLLSSSVSRLEELAFHFPNEEKLVAVEPLLQAIGQNTSLKSLEMYNITCTDERPFRDLLRTWQSHPTLRHIGLNHTFTNEDILEALEVPEFQRHVSLDNYVFGHIENHERDAVLIRLLDKQPKLFFGNECIESKTIRYHNYLNKKGRYLINDNIPEGLLPFILAKVNRYLPNPGSFFDESKSNYMESALYEHLHSTVFLQRSALTDV